MAKLLLKASRKKRVRDQAAILCQKTVKRSIEVKVDNGQGDFEQLAPD